VSALALALGASLAPAPVFAQAAPVPADVNGYPQLSLREALSLSAASDPALAGVEARRRAAEAGVRQADVRPNPNVGLMVENLPTLGGGDILGRTETTLTYEQRLERGGDRPARTALARAEGDLLLADARAAQLDRLEL
ncbi:hypothetical protein LTR94_034091, partial [Friedmanniomyces endolithicus]